MLVSRLRGRYSNDDSRSCVCAVVGRRGDAATSTYAPLAPAPAPAPPPPTPLPAASDALESARLCVGVPGVDSDGEWCRLGDVVYDGWRRLLFDDDDDAADDEADDECRRCERVARVDDGVAAGAARERSTSDLLFDFEL